MRFSAASLAIALVASTLPTHLASAQRATTLSTSERAIVHSVDVHNPAALALLQRLVDINSGTLNLRGVRAVGDVLRAQLDSLGFRTRWVDGARFHRAGHLIAEHPAAGPKILLIGHLDTVFEPGSPFQRFQRIDDSTARGPGVIDMKGGDVIIVQALRALKDAGVLDRLNVTVVYDGDEEEPGAPLDSARAALIEAGRGATAAIGFEDGPGDPRYAVIARRGAGSWKLVTGGVTGHSSQIFTTQIGAGAVNEAARIISQMYMRLGLEQYLTFSPGLIVGGSTASVDTTGTTGAAAGKSNVVADRVIVTGDIRTLTPQQLSRTRADMQAIVAHHLPGTTAELTFADGYPPMAPAPGNRRLLAMYDEVSHDLGFGAVAAVDPSRAGAADVAFVAGEVPMVIDGVGMSGHDDHSDKETADLRMLPVQTKRAAVLLYRLGTPGKITEAAGERRP